MDRYFILEESKCCGPGMLEILTDTQTMEMFIRCDECLSEFESPKDALKFVNGKSEVHPHSRPSTITEIQNKGWEIFIRRYVKGNEKI